MSTTALVHEWLTNLAGSEKVVAAMRDAFPDAPVYTSMWYRPAFPDWDVRPSFLQRFATGPAAHTKVLPLMPPAFRSLRPDADLVVTSFHSFAMHARVPATTPHLVYCHTTPRFLWSADDLAGERIPGGRRALAVAGRVMRSTDRRRVLRAKRFIANSSAVAARMRAAYGVEPDVIHPPVDVRRFREVAGARRGEHFVVLSRLVPYKRVDLAVEAFRELGWPLLVIGTGRMADALAHNAPPNVRFLGHVPDDELPSLLAEARAMIVPAEEDFGITMVEAMAAGTPVVALARGGAVDIVDDGGSGVLYGEPTLRALVDAVHRVADSEWDGRQLSAMADRFDTDRFVERIATAGRDLLQQVG